MTTICWDGETLAFDSLVTCGDDKVAFLKKGAKIDNCLVAVAGHADCIEAFFSWVKDNFSEDRVPRILMEGKNNRYSALVIHRSGKIWYFDNSVEPMMPIKRHGGIVDGSGAPYARAALACGKNATEAVRIAAKFDAATGGRVISLRF